MNDVYKHHCTNCMNQIKDLLFLCAVCQDCELCMMCYSSRAELGPHVTTHHGHIIDLGTFPVFGPEGYVSLYDEELRNEMGREINFSEDDEKTDSEEEDSIKDETQAEYNEEVIESDDQAENVIFDPKEYEEYFDPNLDLELAELEELKSTEQSSSGENVTKKRVWRAVDELALLDGISRFGFGNWKDIAQFLSQKMDTITADEVAKHYKTHYIYGVIGRFFWNWVDSDPSQNKLAKYPFDSENMHESIEENDDNCDYLTDDIQQTELNTIGYLPKRDDFEIEFDNEVEALIANLTVGPPDEDEIETKFKLAQIDMYQQRLIQRFRKKAIARQYELVKKFLKSNGQIDETGALGKYKSDSSNDLSSTQTDQTSIFSPFLRFNSQKDLQILHTDLQKEYCLKLLIRKFLKYKKYGFTKLSDIKQFEEKKKMKASMCATKTKKDNENESNNLDSKAKRGLAKKEIVDGSKAKRRRVHSSIGEEESTISSSSDLSSDEDDHYIFDEHLLKRLLPINSRNKIEEILAELFNTESENDDSAKDEVKEEGSEGNKKDSKLSGKSHDATAESSLHSKIAQRKSRRRSNKIDIPPDTDFDITSYPGCRLLSASEKQLCSEIKLRPTLYISFKTLILKEYHGKNFPKSRAATTTNPTNSCPEASNQSQANLFSNITSEEAERIKNKVSDFLLSIGTISKDT